MHQSLKRTKTNCLMTAIVCIVLGLLMILFPDSATTTICLIIGWAALVTGIVTVVSFLIRPEKIFGGSDLVVGVIEIAIGLWIVLSPSGLKGLFAVVMAILVMLHGVWSLQDAFYLQAQRDPYWWVTLLLALITVGLGVLLLCFRNLAANTVSILAGAFLLYDGISSLVILHRATKLVKRVKAAAPQNVVEVESEIKK